MLSPAEEQSIRKLLDNYTQAVSTGDQKLFESQLLDLSIPFFGFSGKFSESANISLQGLQNYASFRASVFESGNKFSQTFSDIHISGDGELAAAHLRFRTVRLASGDAGEGWKTLQLLKVKGQWNIVSEFYTVQ